MTSSSDSNNSNVHNNNNNNELIEKVNHHNGNGTTVMNGNTKNGIITNNGHHHNPTETSQTPKSYKIELVWRNVFLLSVLHIGAIYGLYLYITQAQLYTMIYTNFTVILLALGITCGAHRLWSHKSYKATLPLRIFLMILNTGMLQNDIYEWSRDHRVHHKFSETDADPHNSRRGFFFAHMGWLLCRKHPDVTRKGKTVDMTDLEQDIVVQFQRQFYKPLALFCTFYLPTIIPYYFWGENFYLALFLSMFRYAFSLHGTWLVNSAAHLYGKQLYDKTIFPVESTLVKYASIGEGYHNYHHVFPYDYSASELSWSKDINISTMFIDACAALGLASNLKKVDPTIIKNRIQRTGDQELNKVYVESTKNHQNQYMATVFPMLIIMVALPAVIYFLRRTIQSL